MITLVIGNSTCQVQGLTMGQHKALREKMAYSISAQAAFFSKSFKSPKRYLLDKKGFFPTGLLYIVEEYLSATPHRMDDLRYVPKTRQLGLESLFVDGRHPTPYPEQIEAAEAALKGRGIIVAPTGVGKSLIAALICDMLQVPTLIVVPSLELKRQLTATLSYYFGSELVGPLRQGASSSFISVENVDALDPTKPLEGIDLVIIDEFHHSGAKTYRELNKKAWAGVYFKIGLTATPFRSQDHERLLLESVLSKVIYRIDYRQAVEKGYIVPMDAYYIELPKRKVKGHTWGEVYSELVVNNKERNTLIADLMQQLHRDKRSTLCLVKEIKHGNNISELIGAAFASGVSDETPALISAFNEKKLTCLIGTTGVLGEGVDTKPAEYIIIAGLGKSKNAFAQQIGRGFRVYAEKTRCVIILFRDPSHRWTLNHFNEQVKILKSEYGVTPGKL